MTSQAGKQKIYTHIFPSISKSKDNQTKKSGQLIEYTMWNIFVEKPYTKCGGPFPRTFSKKSELGISLDRFSYAETWELLNLFFGAKRFSYHICDEN